MNESVVIYDIGTVVKKAERQEYTEFLRDNLDASKVEFVAEGDNPELHFGGQKVIRLRVFGSIKRLAITRIRMRQKGWTLMWEDDAIDNGIIDPELHKVLCAI